MYHLVAAATLVDTTPPWICHMLMVAMSAVLFDRPWLKRWQAIALSCLAGLAGAWVLQAISIGGRGWFDMWVYWHDLLEGVNSAKLRSDPVEFFGILMFRWVAPILIALAVLWSRRQLWKTEGDQPSRDAN